MPNLVPSCEFQIQVATVVQANELPVDTRICFHLAIEQPASLPSGSGFPARGSSRSRGGRISFASASRAASVDCGNGVDFRQRRVRCEALRPVGLLALESRLYLRNGLPLHDCKCRRCRLIALLAVLVFRSRSPSFFQLRDALREAHGAARA